MSAIRTAFTDLSTVSVDPGYLVLMADLDGYLKIKETSSNVINVSKTLNYFTQSDSGNYLRWVNPNFPAFEIVNGTFSVGGSDLNVVGEYSEDDSFLFANGIIGNIYGGYTQSGIIFIDKNIGSEYFVATVAGGGVSPISGVLMGQLILGQSIATTMGIGDSMINFSSFTSSVGYTHSVWTNVEEDIMVLNSDGSFGQHNFTTGFELVNKTQSFLGFEQNFSGSFYTDDQFVYEVGVSFVDSIGSTRSGITSINLLTLESFGVSSTADPDNGSLNIGYYNFTGEYGNQINIDRDLTQYFGWTSSVGYTHSVYVNADFNDIMVLYNDGQFEQTNYSTGFQLVNKTQSFFGIYTQNLAGSYYENSNTQHFAGVAYSDLFGATISSINTFNKNSGDIFMINVDSGQGGATGDTGAITIGKYNFSSGVNTQIAIADHINYIGRTSSTGFTHSRFVNGDTEDIMVLYNDGDFIQNNLSTGLYLFNGTFSTLGGAPICGSVFTSGDESFVTGIQSSNGITSSIIAYAKTNIYSNYVKANGDNVVIKYIDLTNIFDQGVEVDSTGTKIVGLTANSNTNLVITNSLENKFEFYNDGNLKMKNNVGSVYFNGVDQYVTVANSLVTPNSHILISASYSGPTTPTIGWVEKGNGTFSVNDKNGLTMSYSYLIINSI